MVAIFLGQMVDLGVVGVSPAIEFATIKRVVPQVRRGRNPFTGEVIEIRAPSRCPTNHHNLKDANEVAELATGVAEFDACVSGKAQPQFPPLEIDFGVPYHLSVRCRVRSQLVSTSQFHGKSWGGRKIVGFGQDCTTADSLGVYTHPETLETILVPGAGCARIWIEFELGKCLFPRIENGNLAILNCRIVELARESFGTEFAQGCYWSA
jgi:hypothetical protein